jgi:pectin methylesterase-like acyl-CoA thioesterase/lysophospholipase L1-like esterase
MLKMKKVFKTFMALFAFGAALTASAQSRKTDVWDFGGVEDKDAVNHITVADIDKLEGLAADGKFEAGDYVFGDLTLKTDKNDRAYYNGAKNYGTQGYSSVQFEDGYTSDGIYYCNGKGGETRRYMLLKNVKAGDVITFYGRASNSSEDLIHFASVNDAGEKTGAQDETAWLNSISKRFSYIATQNGSYKVYTEATAAKPVYYRITRTPGVAVSGALSGLSGKAELRFVVKETKQEIAAKVSGASYSAGLPAGYSFTAVLGGVKGYGISSETKIITIAKDAPASLKKNLAVAEMKTYTVDGKITGFEKDFKTDNPIKIIMTPPQGSLYLPVEADVTVKDGEYYFKGELEPAVAYTASLSGANDYFINTKTAGNADFTGETSFTKDIEVAKLPVYDINGKFIGNVNPMPSSIQFKKLEDGYVYPGAAANGIYGAKLRDGNYEVICETENAVTMNHITVNGANVTKDILMTSKDKTVHQIPLKKEIYVGGKKADYKTVKEAVEAAHAMAPKSEADRITIHIAPGVYRAQLLIDTPYITLKNDTPSQEVKLTWYYGIGYAYYSCDLTGYYDAERAYDKFDKKTAARWGVATYVKKNAKFFRAEGITFETSFNKYVTAEELKDGVEVSGDTITFVRKLNSDVQSKKATERSAAICVEADESEFRDCSFLGSQDTLYTGTGTRQYYKNCYIEGNTDFIFGDGDVVFEECEIAWAGYSDSKNAGYLTAARTANQKGYLFYNCIISQNSYNMQTPGYFGRPWGPQASVAFVNTVFSTEGIIDPMGWTSMSGNKPGNANFFEYNSIWEGKSVDVSHRDGGKIIADAGAYSPQNYFIGWTPVYYSAPKGGEAKIKKASFTTDDDINTPYPGHTVTLHYEYSGSDTDSSLIQWYRTKDKKDVLIKQSTGYADKTYLISTADTGFTLKAVITPMSRGGNAGKQITVNLDKKINAGWSVPSKASAVRPRAEGKVNVFLASDSTCKDYSALGMWNNGQTRNEGAWGEFLQCFFNGAVSVQNYANGGRSSRNFINEGSLEKIRQQIGKGDYLFIQFGHNDCSNGAGYLEDRYVPLGEPNKKGIFPINEGKKVRTPDSYVDKYGTTFYSYDCGATYKWYLMQYVNVALEAGATPVLVTPVSRMYFDGKGRITPHHDSKETSTKTQITRNNAYVEAVRQLAKEKKILLIDGFEITKALYEKAYTDCGNNMEARELMFAGDSTHNNKLGGFVIAGEFAKEIKKNIPGLAPSIIHPKNAMGENNDGKLMFTVDQDGKMESYDRYWARYEQGVMDSLGK